MALNTLGSNRDQLADLAIEDRRRLITQQVLIEDPRRWRPRWFDGRFLAASDLQAEQNYFLVRQADLGRAGGSGVVEGLEVDTAVEVVNGVTRLRIRPGQGVTDTGELVVLPEGLDVLPASVPDIQRLDAAFGIQMIPNEPGRSRTGLYILALRPVEWTDSPIGAYPTSLTGTRTVEDGTIVEGVAVTLIPYPDTGDERSWSRRRARVAREIFVEGRDRGLLAGALPLAMVALSGNFIEWVDMFLVRRDAGAERPAGMDFGFGKRPLREAHLLQYQRHLADSLNASSDAPFAATAYFDSLPPIGQFPSATINPDLLTQSFFPPGVGVDLSFVPEDELPALIEESLLLPPLDLTSGLDEMKAAGVVVLVPLARADFDARRGTLADFTAPLVPAFRRVKADLTPLQRLLGRSQVNLPPSPPPDGQGDWQQLLRDALGHRLLWYVRRRHLPTAGNFAGKPVSATNDAVADPIRFSNLLLANPDLMARFNRLRALNSPEVNSLVGRLAETRFLSNPALLRSVLTQATSTNTTTGSTSATTGGALQPHDAVSTLAPLTDPKLGQGLALIQGQDGNLARSLQTDRIANTGVLAQVDQLAREVPPEQLPALVTGLRGAMKTRTTDSLPRTLVHLREKLVKPQP